MSRNEDVRNICVRQKNILYLIQRYLNDNGLFGTASILQTEGRLSEDFELCDNIDLDAMYLEYASYYHLKFGKYPKILKKSKQLIKVEIASKRKKAKTQSGTGSCTTFNTINGDTVNGLTDVSTTTKYGTHKNSNLSDVNDLQVTVVQMNTHPKLEDDGSDTLEKKQNIDNLNRLREVQHGNYSPGSDILLSSQEWQNLADLVRSTIVSDDIKLTWSDIYGNAMAIEIIKEAVLTPIKYPEMFCNGLKPWRSVLLHGPPGSGKTMLAKVLYAETNHITTFFNITSSMIVSKWRGESEKLLKILFYLAQKNAPSIIFLDEIEGLTSKRDRISDHESSKRFKNELLQLMDGLEQSNAGIFVLASTNLPWEIDDAFLRRFEKKLLVQLPDDIERASLIVKLLPINIQPNEEQLTRLIKLSINFTGDEIRLACKEIAMQAVRRLTNVGNHTTSKDNDIPLDIAFKQIRPLSITLLERHMKWQREYGS